MTDEDLKKIRELIKEELRSTKDLVEMIKKKTDSQEFFVSAAAENVRRIKEQQSLMNEKLDEIKEVIDQHTGALVTIENTIKIYGDMYKLNNDNMKRLEKRLETLEDHVGIKPPPELTLAEVQ